MLFVAELSGNHNGSLDRALDIVEAAGQAGATHFKIQTFKPETITQNVRDERYLVPKSQKLWGDKYLFDLYTEVATPYEWHAPIFEKARQVGITPFSSPFDESAVDFLEGLETEIYKVASLEIVDHPLLRRIAQTGKPIIVSTGGATLPEIDDAVEVLRTCGAQDLTLLVCTSDYPTLPENVHLARIPTLAARYGLKVGLSDHSKGVHIALAAIALGAEVIEKHVKLDANDDGLDSAFSIGLAEFKSMVWRGQEVKKAIGDGATWSLESEEISRSLRPSIVATQDIRRGEAFSYQNTATLRPNIGLPPSQHPHIIGKRANVEISRGSGIVFEAIGD